MIKINTYHITADEPYLLEGDEKTEVLDYQRDPHMQLSFAPEFHYRLYGCMAGSDLVITGKAMLRLRAECSRCGTEFETEICANDICLHFEKVQEQEVDLTDQIREELLLAFPTYFYCKPDCKGICSGCGADLNHESCRCDLLGKNAKDTLPDEDSPWKALDALKK